MIPVAFLLKSFLTLFLIVDPVGLIPIFISFTGESSTEERFAIARRAILVAAGVLFSFSLLGGFLLEYLRISIEAFQVAAGILLFKIAVDMVFGEDEPPTEANKPARSPSDISIFPLAIPLVAGPGTLASMTILANEAKEYSYGLLAVLGITAVVLGLAFIILWVSGAIADVFGKIGINVLTRVLGMLLTALAVQYVVDGGSVLLKAAVV